MNRPPLARVIGAAALEASEDVLEQLTDDGRLDVAEIAVVALGFAARIATLTAPPVASAWRRLRRAVQERDRAGAHRALDETLDRTGPSGGWRVAGVIPTPPAD